MSSVSPGTGGKRPPSPIGFRLFDPLGGAGDEIPPEVRRPVERRATEQQNPDGSAGGQSDRVAAGKDQHPAFPEAVAADLDTALNGVDRPVFVLRRDFQPGARANAAST